MTVREIYRIHRQCPSARRRRAGVPGVGKPPPCRVIPECENISLLCHVVGKCFLHPVYPVL